MNKIQFDKLLKPLINLYDEIELDIVRNILERIDNYSGVKGSLEWYLDKLSETRLFDKDNLIILKKNKRKLKQILMDIADYSGNNIDNLEQLKGYYQNNLISVDPTTLYDSIAIKNLIHEAFKDCQDIMDLINTKALEGAKKSYKQVLNKAYLETAGGFYSYTEAVRRATNEMAKQGIKTVNYESGIQLSIEAVVRRDIVTRMNKLVGDCEIEHAKQLDTNLVYVDQHLGARVRTEYMKHDYEAHCEWQGKKYMLEGSSEEYPNLYETTGYGEMLGLKGINCYHNIRPTWEWETIPDVIDEVENAIEYEKLQRKRILERKSRELKRRKSVASYFNDNDEVKVLNTKLNKFNSDYDAWLEENGLARDYSREYIASSKTSTMKTDNQSSYQDVTQEWLDKATPNKGNVINRDYYVDKKGNKYIVDGKNVVFEPSQDEIDTANFIHKTFGGNIYLNPKINNPDNVESCDYLWKNQMWDKKTIGKEASSLTRAVDNAIKGHKEQTDYIVLDITKSKIEQDILVQQSKKIFSTKGREWVKGIMIINNNKVIGIYMQNKRD